MIVSRKKQFFQAAGLIRIYEKETVFQLRGAAVSGRGEIAFLGCQNEKQDYNRIKNFNL